MKRLSRRTKIIRGTFRSSREAKFPVDPDPLGAAPPPPRDLGKHGKAKWRELAAELTERRVLTRLDLPAFWALCSCWEFYADARDLVYGTKKKRSLEKYLKGKSSQGIPAAVLMKQMLALYRSYLSEFGLTPAARGRVSMDPPKKPEEDPMEAILRGE